jgi:hypothetical protein
MGDGLDDSRPVMAMAEWETRAFACLERTEKVVSQLLHGLKLMIGAIAQEKNTHWILPPHPGPLPLGSREMQPEYLPT